MGLADTARGGNAKDSGKRGRAGAPLVGTQHAKQLPVSLKKPAAPETDPKQTGRKTEGQNTKPLTDGGKGVVSGVPGV